MMRVIEFPGRITQADIERLHKQLRERGLGDVLILENGATLKQFDGLPIPDAICLHCGRANLQSAYQCLGCNAPLVRESKQ